MTLRLGNDLLRQGKYAEALAIFARLREKTPNLLPYEQGYFRALQLLHANRDSATGAADSFLQSVTHPGGLKQDSNGSTRFVVVTPVLNGARFLEASLNSVLGQIGTFFIDYYVKDAGSTDGTLDILLDYQCRIGSGNYPIQCDGIRLRVESSADKGLYDAVGHAFDQFNDQRRPDDILSYLNADDVYAEDAFRIVANVFARLPAQWVCGQTRVINESGDLVVSPQFPLPYSREDILAGLHDGRSLNVIQQEGSFWRRDLYDAVGGIDRTMALAGDFELWLRFSQLVELLALDRHLASFRTRPGQLSSQMDRYYAEVDGVMSRVNIEVANSAASPSWQGEFLLGGNDPVAGMDQHPGPVCFTNEDGTIREVAYIKRAWINW